ncbi:putative NAD/FAD-binding protein [Pseudomonas laurylsulfatiphila]
MPAKAACQPINLSQTYAEPLWELACQRWRPASRSISHRHTPNHCGSWLARDGGLPADQSLSDIRRTTVGAGLPAMAACQPTNLSQTYAEPLWELACQRWRRASRPISDRHTPNHCGSWLAREGGLPADHFLQRVQHPHPPANASTPAISAPHTTPHLHDCSRSKILQWRSPVAGQWPVPIRCRRCCGCGSFPRGRKVPSLA